MTLLVFSGWSLGVLQANTPSESYQQEEVRTKTLDEAQWQEIIEGIDYSKDLHPAQAKKQETENTD
ncbi:MAG: hypothetical protein AAF738_07005, partial [Bacteroidota bacterium]